MVAHGAGRGVAYELVYDGQGKDGTPFLAGLIDLTKLGGEEPSVGVRSAPGRPGIGGWSGGAIAISSSKDSEKGAIAVRSLGNADLGSDAARPVSHLQPPYVNGAIAGRP